MRRACLTVAVLATAVFTGWAAQPPALGASSGGQEAVTIASGVSKIARWELYARTPKPGRRCLGMRVEQLWDATAVARRERCGARRIAKGAVTLQTLAAPGMGSFAFGRARPRVGQVNVTVGDQAPATVGDVAEPARRRDRFWVAHAGLSCAPVSVRALAGEESSPAGRSPPAASDRAAAARPPRSELLGEAGHVGQLLVANVAVAAPSPASASTPQRAVPAASAPREAAGLHGRHAGALGRGGRLRGPRRPRACRARPCSARWCAPPRPCGAGGPRRRPPAGAGRRARGRRAPAAASITSAVRGADAGAVARGAPESPRRPRPRRRPRRRD